MTESSLEGLETTTMAERPELLELMEPALEAAFPEFLNHDAVWFECWPALLDNWPELHVFVVEEGREAPLAMVSAVPIAWDGTPEGLPPGTHATMRQSLAEHAKGTEQNTTCGIQGVMDPEALGRGLGTAVMEAFFTNSKRLGYEHLLSPIRPTAKQDYPTIPLDHYANWTLPDGEPMDPWLRLQTRAGGKVLGVCHDSLVMDAPVADWEEWTGLVFPEDGSYVIPDGHELLVVDRAADNGHYSEAHVWFSYER